MNLDISIKGLGFTVRCVNEAEAVAAMADAVADRVRRKLAFGLGATGKLPLPKDGGRPLNRTGQLAASIGYVLRQKGRGRTVGPLRSDAAYELTGVVRALGPRDNAAQVKKRVAARRASYRAEAKAALERGQLTGRIDPTLVRQLKSGGLKIRSRRIRGVEDNGALVAVLSNPPKDLRSRNGNRAVYTIFAATPEYRRIALEAARRVARFEAVAGTDTGTAARRAA